MELSGVAMLCFVIFCYVLLCEFGKKNLADGPRGGMFKTDRAEESREGKRKIKGRRGIRGGIPPQLSVRVSDPR